MAEPREESQLAPGSLFPDLLAILLDSGGWSEGVRFAFDDAGRGRGGGDVVEG